MWIELALSGSFPRVRGDVPTGNIRHTYLGGFSPRARGCSGFPRKESSESQVFPACAGMFRPAPSRHIWRPGFPRVRGDVPLIASASEFTDAFSPRARGCSLVRPPNHSGTVVFPACAGMFLGQTTSQNTLRCFPRVRGDVPPYTGEIVRTWEFSPRARGCSGHLANHRAQPVVFPACAGMFLAGSEIDTMTESFPRVRGDVPGRWLRWVHRW